jgi:capsid protein
MSRFVRPLLAVLLALSSAFAGVSSVRAADMLGVYEVDTGICTESWVLRRITNRFAYQVRHVPNLPQVAITGFHDIYLNRYLPAQDRRPIGRTYCGAKVALSDGYSRDIWYLIEEGQGYAGIGDNVEFCVSGFDRWYVYNGACRVLR